MWWARRAAIAGASALALVALIATVPPLGGGDGRPDSVKVAARNDDTPGDTATLGGDGSAPAPQGTTTTSTTTSAVRQPGGNSASGTVSTVPGRASTTTSSTLPGSDPCRNNNGDERCGEFRWAHDPGTNAPLEFEISYTPSQPKPGQTVTFTVHVSDPDASPIRDCGQDYDGGGGGCAHTMECALNNGTWDVPPRQRGEATFSHQHAFATAGAHTVRFYAESLDGAKSRSSCSARPNPYASDGYGETTVRVAP